TIDAAEWCCPKPDLVFGFQKVLKNYYLQGLHQNVVNGEMIFNKDVYNKLTEQEKYAMEIASEAMITRNITNRAVENGKALIELTSKHGVILHDTPADYFVEYMAAAKATIEKNSKENKFFEQVYKHMTAHAKIVVPFIAQMETSDASIGNAFAKTQ
ncbi:C4-dicarboxylate ABC transporter substrate-binding protein, partial [Candidatus Pelagibacter sp.]|nr:C4-dicarboxylate ABC transporter substrate-binding protein [Candidatus Pelagibacter sp.]